MKKIYIKPILEMTECVHATALLEGSNDFHGEGKDASLWGDDHDTDDDQIQKMNLWDD